jgi:recombination protein RecR
MHIVEDLIVLISKVNGLNLKSAKKFTINLLENKELLEELLSRLINLNNNIKKCEICNNFSTESVCSICLDQKRDQNILCIVKSFADLMSIEKTKYYNGLYYILEHDSDIIFQEQIDLMISKYKNLNNINEIFIVMGFDQFAKINSIYIKNHLQENSYNKKITIMSSGIPDGSNLEYIDSSTMILSIKNRVEL